MENYEQNQYFIILPEIEQFDILCSISLNIEKQFLEMDFYEMH